jgi:hypothetical protein
MTVKIFTIAHVAPELQNAWLQHLRDFDTANPGCHFEICVDGPPEQTLVEIVEILRLDPALSFTEFFKRG